MRRKEVIPNPSQPKKITRYLSLKMSNNIDKTNLVNRAKKNTGILLPPI